MTTLHKVESLTRDAINALNQADRVRTNVHGQHSAEHYREVAAVYAELAKANAIAAAR